MNVTNLVSSWKRADPGSECLVRGLDLDGDAPQSEPIGYFKKFCVKECAIQDRWRSGYMKINTLRNLASVGFFEIFSM